MRNQVLYTAVGRLRSQINQEITQHPIILIGSREFLVDPQEFMIWISLNWRICTWDEIGKHYERYAAQTGYKNPRTWEACVNRLLTRGLLASGSGETLYDALYDLMSSMYIVPTMCSFPLRLYAVGKMMLLGKVPIPAAVRFLRSYHHSESEKQIIQFAKRTSLTVAEVICCIEKRVVSIKDDAGLMDAIYTDESDTSENIAMTAKGHQCCKDTLETVANLYLNKQLIFERA